ncbi:MAG: hypothetical protein V1826_01255 [bacterium]
MNPTPPLPQHSSLYDVEVLRHRLARGESRPPGSGRRNEFVQTELPQTPTVRGREFDFLEFEFVWVGLVEELTDLKACPHPHGSATRRPAGFKFIAAQSFCQQ